MALRRWLALAAVLTGVLAASGVVAADVLLWDSLRPGATPTPPVAAGLSTLSADGCAGCHKEVAREWASSRMAGSYVAASFQVDWAAKDRLPYCLNCHAPLEVQQDTLVSGVWWPMPLTLRSTPNPAFDVDLQAEGVTCVVCHALGDGAIATTREVRAPHATRVDPTLTERCARCHQSPEVYLHPLDRPMFDTVGEHGRWKVATGATESCVDCHLPAVERAGGRAGRRHTFRGGWDAEVVTRAATLSEVTSRADGWTVVVTNRAGHALPTGETTGDVALHWVGLDADGREVATRDDVFARRIGGPPFVDLGDTTLAGGEARTMTAALPAEVVAVRVELTLRRYTSAPHLLPTVPAVAHRALVATSTSR